MTLREKVARTICQSGRFETGQGTCSMLCLDVLGDARAKPCPHATEIHGNFADAVLLSHDFNEAAIGKVIADAIRALSEKP